MNTNDGGPAFPFAELNGDGTHYYSHGGMCLRDYFAAKAIPEAVRWETASPTGEKSDSRVHNGPTYKGIATRAYLLADAMIAARAPKDQP